MKFPFRVLNWVFLVIAAILEILALYYLIELDSSHCIQAGEYGISVWLYMYFLPGFMAHTVVLALFRIFFRTVGLDPIVRNMIAIFNNQKIHLHTLQAVAYNLVTGILCIIITLILLIAMMDHCGNEFAYMFYTSGGCGLVAGILHLANAIMCLVYMPAEEAHYLKPARA